MKRAAVHAKTFAVILFFTACTVKTVTVEAQQSLEFTSGAGNPTGNGPAVNSQLITFQANTNNPNGNNFIPFNPQVTTTFSFSNQQYTVPAPEISTGTGLNFGANINHSDKAASTASLFGAMNSIGSPSNSHFTSVNNILSGTGIDISSNRAVNIFTSARPLYHAGASTSGRYYYGDLTITFNKFVINPVLHIVGLGGFYSSGGNTLGFTTELEMTGNLAVLSKLSGSPELEVSPNKILNNASHPHSGTGAGSASGSVLVLGSVRSLTFKVYLRGDGGNSSWSASNMHPGDLWMMGVSTLAAADLPLPVKLSSFTATLGSPGKADLKWSTATEINASHFVVERSTDGSHFTETGMVFAMGNTTDNMNYSFSDNLSGLNATTLWYRLRSVDMDGKTEYSATRIIRLQQPKTTGISIQAFPNPATTELRVSIPAEWQGKPVMYELVNMSGQVVKRVQTGSSSQVETISLLQVAPGFYMARVNCEGQQAQQKIVKQ